MATPNFFDNYDRKKQVDMLTSHVFGHIQRYKGIGGCLGGSTKGDLVREVTMIFFMLGIKLDFAHESIGAIHQHDVWFFDTARKGYHVAFLGIDTRREEDGSLSYLVTLVGPNPKARRFASVEGFMEVFAAVAFLAKTRPGRRITWEHIKRLVDDFGTSEPVEPLVPPIPPRRRRKQS